MSVTFTGADFSAPISFVGMYSDNTPLVKTDQWDEICKNANSMTLQADSLSEFMVGMFLVDAVQETGGRIETLVLPYLPGARQDRSNPTGDVLFTAKSIAREINSRGLNRVMSIDPHSPVMPSLICDYVNYPLERVAARLWQGYTGIIAPDKGAKHRAEQFADAMDMTVYYGSKVRDVSTGRLTGFDLEPIPEGGHYLVVDDICDGGGTFIGLGEKIKEQNAFADLFVTHGIFSKGTRTLKKIYKNIYTTDSRHLNTDKYVDVLKINVVKEMESYNV